MPKKEIHIRKIKYQTPDYNKELILRDQVLRKPLGMSLFDENLVGEINDYHIGAFIHDKLVGILILTPLNADTVKMRQVAVDETFQSQKVGSRLVHFAEQFSKNKEYSMIVLNARKSAIPFYLKLGYEKISDEFLEINIPHYKMSKSIQYKAFILLDSSKVLKKSVNN